MCCNEYHLVQMKSIGCFEKPVDFKCQSNVTCTYFMNPYHWWHKDEATKLCGNSKNSVVLEINIVCVNIGYY